MPGLCSADPLDEAGEELYQSGPVCNGHRSQLGPAKKFFAVGSKSG